MKKSFQNEFVVAFSVAAMLFSAPGTVQAGTMLIPGGALVKTAQGGLWLIRSIRAGALFAPAMGANAKDKKGNQPSKGKDRDGDSRYNDSKSRGRSGTFEGNTRGGSGERTGWGSSGGDGRYGQGGDSYGGLFSVEDMGRLVKEVATPENAIAATLFLSVNDQETSPVSLEDHLANYLQNNELYVEKVESSKDQVAMPTTIPSDLEKIMDSANRRISQAASGSLNEIADWNADQRLEQLNQYLVQEGLDLNNPDNQIVGIVSLNKETVAELEREVPELGGYFRNLIFQ